MGEAGAGKRGAIIKTIGESRRRRARGLLSEGLDFLFQKEHVPPHRSRRHRVKGCESSFKLIGIGTHSIGFKTLFNEETVYALRMPRK